MNIEIITIGDELLIGQIVDTNSAWMADYLNNFGFEVVQLTTISDNRESIVSALNLAKTRANIILITGGLGPTKDDITKKTLCEYFGDEMEFRDEIFQNVKSLFASLNIPMPEVNRAQAEVPISAIHLMNKKGTAPGMWFEHDENIIVSMPGVPYEMKYLMEYEVVPRLMKIYSPDDLVYKTVLTQGIGESSLMEKIGDWESNLLNQKMGLAWLPALGRVRLRISAKGEGRVGLEKAIDDEIGKLKILIPDYFAGIDVNGVEVEVGILLQQKKWTLSTAESCTGGLVAHKITSVAGSSSYFEGSIVSYSNRVKEVGLGVKWESLKEHGPVSQQVVEEMVVGVKKKLGTECAISTSGIAGPEGGSDENPIGTIWISVSTPERTVSECFHFGKDREKNIERSAQTALRMLQKELLKYS